MFDKIVTIDNKIALVKWIISWEEELFVGFDEETGKEQTKVNLRSEWIVSQAEKDNLIQNLEDNDIQYTISDVEIPKALQPYDGKDWHKGREEAVLYINGKGEYNPALVQITTLKEFLNTDWRWRQERNNFEQKEIALNLRTTTTEKEEDLVHERARIVTQIHELEETLDI